MIGHKCPWCRFHIRIGDCVVQCPCGNCNTWFHDDLYRHLTCWNAWHGPQGNKYCPVTGAQIVETIAADRQTGGQDEV